MAKQSKSQANEAELWKLIAEHFAGNELDLDEIADHIYTNAKGEVYINLPIDSVSGDSGEWDEGESSEDGGDQSEDDSPSESDEMGSSEQQEQKDKKNTSNVVNVLDALRSRNENKPTGVSKSRDKMNQEELQKANDDFLSRLNDEPMDALAR